MNLSVLIHIRRANPCQRIRKVIFEEHFTISNVSNVEFPIAPGRDELWNPIPIKVKGANRDGKVLGLK
jgi:hypothetical protein